ncbi:MAG: transcription-repair coupling factor [Bacteroidota bacterium]
MNHFKQIDELYSTSKPVLLINDLFFTHKRLNLKNISGSSLSFIINAIYKTNKKPTLVVVPEKEEAVYLYNDLLKISNCKIDFFPSSYKRNVQDDQIDPENIVLRTEVLNDFSTANLNPIIITHPEAIAEKVINRQKLRENTLSLKKGELISLDFLVEVLFEYDFERVDFVYEPGQYAVRGSIIDVYSFSNDLPYRIDFFGDEVDTIRTFDIENQISIEKIQKISIVPNIQNRFANETKISIIDFVPEKTNLFVKDLDYCIELIDKMYQNTLNQYKENKESIENIIVRKDEIVNQIEKFQLIEISQKSFFNPDKIIEYNSSKQPAFNKNFDLLISELKSKDQDNYSIFIASSNQNQTNRISAIISEKDPSLKYITISETIHEGFIDHELKICVFTDHQIFDRYHRFIIKERFGNKSNLTLSEITNLNPGDFIVHVDHGIGIFGGLEKIEVNSKPQEAVKLVYKDKDVIYVNIHSLHKISKYKGKEGETPKIYKLGSGAWQKLKQNTKKKVKDIAKDLISLYAKRKNDKGFGFSADTYLNQELEASFIYEDTPDQEKACCDVKTDMEQAIPMDRLICGDVGFGKTEIAIRAAFKAVCDNKQVAVLVPTTILALQHYNTFSERLKDFPSSVEYISRFKTQKKQKDILKNLESGQLDIIIGTHKLIGKDVKFKDLGLLIIDEEQKFGVAVKEKLKQIKVNVDTLTLTATPIPRTLQFSLMGARDLSIMHTPPPNRHPIITEVHTFNNQIIKEAIEYEIERGGQVFFINNRIQNIIEIQTLIHQICPTVKTAIAHGQMEGNKLEDVMIDFINEDYGVLIATSIIENGLDIPNANTIIINNAHHFGLSDLHQLRGRVGRSNKKAFCYLLAPPLSTLTPDARRRLKAIGEYAELGSGFNIALQDMDIRGAGNLLGAEQSGFIADIGFETYQKILNEAIMELKENEFKDVFTEDDDFQQIYKLNPGSDCVIDTDLELLIPESYISNIAERIKLYKQLDNLSNEVQLEIFKSELSDRFGLIPQQTSELCEVVKLRWIAEKLGIEKIVLKNNVMICYFIGDYSSSYYQSDTFKGILDFLQKNPKKCQMKEGNNKLSLTFKEIDSVGQAMIITEKILKSIFG